MKFLLYQVGPCIKRKFFMSGFLIKYFMYYEDIDFCFRIWKFTDYTVDYVKDAVAYHKFSSSSGALSIKKHFYLKRSRFIFILKNYPLNFLRKIIPEITKYEFGFIMKDLLLRYDFINLWREFYIYLIFIAKFPLIIGSRLLRKDNRNKLRLKKQKNGQWLARQLPIQEESTYLCNILICCGISMKIWKRDK